MTTPDVDPELEALLTRMADAQAESQRVHRRTILLGAGGLALLFVLDTGLVVLAGNHHDWWRDVVMVSGLTALGLSGFWGSWVSHQVIARQDTSLLKEMRRNAELAAELQTVTPLLRAINEAHGKGQPLMVMPPDDDATQAPDGPHPTLN